MSDLTIDGILNALDSGHQRATYGAVAALLQTSPRTLMQGRERDQRHSWSSAAGAVSRRDTRRSRSTRISMRSRRSSRRKQSWRGTSPRVCSEYRSRRRRLGQRRIRMSRPGYYGAETELGLLSVIARDADAMALPFVVIARALRTHCPFLNAAVLKLSVTGESLFGAASRPAMLRACSALRQQCPCRHN